MSFRNRWRRFRLPWLLLAALVACLAARFGPAIWDRAFQPQTLPDPWSIEKDDIQYFPPAPDFKLSREAAAQKQYQIDLENVRAHQADYSAETSSTCE